MYFVKIFLVSFKTGGILDMKIVTINGSPRKNGCCSNLIEEIIRGVNKKNTKVTNFTPNSMKIRGCQACMFCKTGSICAINDDMTNIYKSIDDSNIIIIGVPIYSHEMSSQIKTVFDRFYAYTRMDHNFNFSSVMKKNKKCLLVISYGNNDMKVYKSYIDSLIEKFKHIGFDDVEVFVASDSMSYHPEYLEECYHIGASLY